MKKRGFAGGITIVVLSVAISLSGCAQRGPLLVEFGYQPPREEAANTELAVAVSPFRDERGKSESLAGRRFSNFNDQANELVVQGTVSRKVTEALKSAFRARGITVRDGAPWDRTEAGIPAAPATLLVSGEIRNLWVEALSPSLANTNLKATVELRLIVADVANRKIIRALNVNSVIERTSVAYSGEFAQSAMSEALSIALNRLFHDEELRSRLQQ